LLVCKLPVNGQSLNTSRPNSNLKPPLGWNSWDSYGKFPTEKAMLGNIETMAVKLKPFGYQYFVIDAGWDIEKDIHGKLNGVAIDSYGRYIPAKSVFPQGLELLIQRAHRLGLKFGLHIMRGIPRVAYKANTPVYGSRYFARDVVDTTSVCSWNTDNYGVDMSKPGAQAYYDSYIGQLVAWGVDFIKADDITEHPAEVEAVKAAIRKTGKKIVLSLSPGDNARVENVEAYNQGNMLRVTGDIWDNQQGFATSFNAWKKWANITDRKFWLDMDMIPFGHLCLQNPDPNFRNNNTKEEGNKTSRGKERMSALTDDQKYTFITIRALSASPLFMGGDLPTSDEHSIALITNKKMLACNQNGIVGKLIYNKDGIEIWKTPNKNNPLKGWIGIFNRTQQQQSITLNSLLLESKKDIKLRNIWLNKDVGKISSTPIVMNVNANGVVFCSYD
jgi:alpha-galactosidase